MKINFNPQRDDADLVVSVAGDVITVNGEIFDFSSIPDGASLPSAAVNGGYFSGDISRNSGEIELTLIFPHKANAATVITYPASVSITSGTVVDSINNIYPWSLAS